MTLRVRILVATALLVLLPLVLLGQFVSHWMHERFTRQYHQRVAGMVEVIRDDLAARDLFVAERLAAIREELLDDNRFRMGLQGRDAAATALRDRAVRAMHLLGLDMLQFQDERGEILSCGHHWSMYGSQQPGLVALLRTRPATLVAALRQEGPFLAQVRIDSLRIADRTLYLIGGAELGPRQMRRAARDPDLEIRLRLPEDLGMIARAADGGRSADGRPAIHRSIELPLWVEEAGEYRRSACALELHYPLAPLDELLRGFRQWLFVIVGVLAVGSLLLAVWLSRQISRPLAELARRSSRIDLETLDARFSSRRDDEVGVLARVLDQMMARLRTSARRLREVEHRATLGEMARQVNHDVKNGLIPIRNVFRHLTDLLPREPQSVARVLEERRPVIEASIAYLEDLAANYARISSRPRHSHCRCNEVVQQAVQSMGPPPNIRVDLSLDPAAGHVAIDTVALRRIIENLLRNALDSLGASGGRVRVWTRAEVGEAGEAGVGVVVHDSGPGIPAEIRASIFEDFFTTKAQGSGLGLSIVRRLVSDAGGTIQADHAAEGGARFVLWLPSATSAGRPAQARGPAAGCARSDRPAASKEEEAR